jgi:hypothetical protein
MPNIGIKQTFTMHAQAIDFGMGDSPIDTGSRLSCRLDGLSSTKYKTWDGHPARP